MVEVEVFRKAARLLKDWLAWGTGRIEDSLRLRRKTGPKKQLLASAKH